MTRHTRASARSVPLAPSRYAALFGLAALMVASLLLSGCNTTAGAGQDINATGAAITRGADSVKGKL